MITLVFPSNGAIEHFIPLGIAYVGTVLRNNGFPVSVLDMRIHSEEDFIRAAKTSQFLGFSVKTIYLSNALHYAKLAKLKNPKIKIIFGGPHPTIFPRETLESPYVDFVAIGEGELTAPDFFKNYSSPEKVLGIGYKERGKIKINPPRELLWNLDELVFPDRELFPLDIIMKKTPYWPPLTPYPSLSMLSIRGCPYNCIYCQPTLRKIYGNVVRRRSAKRSVDEMEYLYKKYKPVSIFMADDLFTSDKKWTLDFCHEVRRRKLHKKLVWECESRVNTFDEEIAREIKKSGCYMVWFGTESYCQNTLNTLRKGTLVEQNMRAAEICRKYKLLVLEQLMVGNPNETLEDLHKTVELSKKAKADITAVAVTTPTPGSDLFGEFKKKKLLLIKNLDQLGSRFKGKTKFKLKYSQKELEKAFNTLKQKGEISLLFILTRDYYRQLFFKRLKSHVRTRNFISIFADFGRIIYGLFPAKTYPFLNRAVDPVKNLILSSFKPSNPA